MNKRIVELDMLRGLAVAIMIIVNSPPGEIYSTFNHAQWKGLTFADWAFPGFVFAMGASMAVSISRRQPSLRKIIFRAGLLFAIGILFNTLPHIFTWLFWEDVNFYSAAIEHGRLFGVLQRLALTYLFGMILIKFIKSDAGILIAAIMLLIISSAGFHIYAPENPFAQTHNISSAIDLVFPGANHIYTSTHDPEGLYGTLASTASLLIGFLGGRILIDNAPAREKFKLTIAAGVIFLIAGLIWSAFDIIAKNIWTAPFALITSGGEMLILALLIKNSHAKILKPLIAFGKNPLTIYLLSEITLMFLYVYQVDGMSLLVWLWQHTIYGLISVKFSAVIFCLIFCAVWLTIAVMLERLGIVIKV